MAAVSHETDAKVVEVLEDILPLINKTLSRTEALDIISERFGVGQRQAENYLAKAHKIIHDKVMENQDETLGSLFNRYESLYEKAIENEDYKEARAVTKDFYDVLGFKKNKIEISGDMKDLFKAIEGLADDNNG